jgi:hypothetical protein
MSDHLSIGFACHSRITVAVTIKTHFSLEQNFFGCHANRNFSVKRWKDSTADFLAQYVKRTVSYFWGGAPFLPKSYQVGPNPPKTPYFCLQMLPVKSITLKNLLTVTTDKNMSTDGLWKIWVKRSNCDITFGLVRPLAAEFRSPRSSVNEK